METWQHGNIERGEVVKVIDLKKKINNKTARLAVIGMGYVGLPLAVEFAKVGFSVLGLEDKLSKVKKINRGENYILKEEGTILKRLVEKGKIRASSNYALLKNVDIIFVCVPTPLTRYREPDISYVESVTTQVARYLHREQLIILESTTYPGTTEEVLLPKLSATGFKVGKDFYLAFSPERVDPGNKIYKTQNIPKIIGGATKTCSELTKSLYKKVMPEVYVASLPKTAEMVKLLENIFRSVNIALVNELALLCKKMGISIWEVVNLASTKPYGFMPFYPGPGLGGHCISKDEYIHINCKNNLETTKIGDIFEKLNNDSSTLKHNFLGTRFIRPLDCKALSFDLNTKKSYFKEIKMITGRYYKGDILTLTTKDGRKLTVTDKHPVVIYDGDLKIKLAKDVKLNDKVVLVTDLPKKSEVLKIDIIEFLVKNNKNIDNIRVKPQGYNFKSYKKVLTPVLKNCSKYYYDYYRYNHLPLKVYIQIEKLTDIPRNKILLSTGKGPSQNVFPAVIEVNEDFSRLIGYYLSEGCITKDESLRTRFTFNRKEKELIGDLLNILKKMQVKFSIYNSKKWQNSCIKVSSNLFGILIRDILRCGINSYNMRIPSIIFSSPESCKKALLSGLFNGDGGVEYYYGKREYKKNLKLYCHRDNRASANYFTSSPVLLQQVTLLAHSLNLVPTYKRKKPLLRFFGAENLKKLSSFFVDKKKKLLEQYFKNKLRTPRSKTHDRFGSFATVGVKEIKKKKGDFVYSMEVKDTHTFVTSYGIITHNCIPIDPFYLTWKAREYDFQTKFIELAGEINIKMPYYVVDMIDDALNKKQKTINKSKILILGVAYKKNIDDPRESPSLKIMEILVDKGAGVSYNDNLIKEVKIKNKIYKSIPLKKISGFDCIVIATDHSYYNFKEIVKKAQLIVDTRNATKGIKSKKVYLL